MTAAARPISTAAAAALCLLSVALAGCSGDPNNGVSPGGTMPTTPSQAPTSTGCMAAAIDYAVGAEGEPSPEAALDALLKANAVGLPQAQAWRFTERNTSSATARADGATIRLGTSRPGAWQVGSYEICR